ncbi:hypothetical protein B0H17DRAFT_1086418 [Mycena rosella]|uniref:Uncharacterized protein n=1 Tax=Mycena rosella TaxID=1033263 RepID=A0AAD7D230_MYCRO|nr:hypothetical protein B0H17DRAFT_1086418 [Mycena rosella]
MVERYMCVFLLFFCSFFVASSSYVFTLFVPSAFLPFLVAQFLRLPSAPSLLRPPSCLFSLIGPTVAYAAHPCAHPGSSRSRAGS